MTLQMLRCFVTVADSRSFSEAADRLYISQPAITRQLHALESELNTTLFDRTKHPAQLTSAGTVLYNDAKDILYRVSLSEEHQKDISLFNDTLFVGCQTTLQVPFLADICQEYYTCFPDVYLNIVELTDIHQNDFFSQPMDLAFLTGDMAVQQRNTRYTCLFKGQFKCIVPQGHRLADRQSISAADLDGETLIMLDEAHCLPQIAQIQAELRRACVNSRFYLASSSLYGFPMIEAGIGVAVMPDFVCPASDRIKQIPFETSLIPEYGIVTAQTKLPSKTEHFIEIAKNIYLKK